MSLVLSLADRARDFLDVCYGADSLDLSDVEAIRRASVILPGQLHTRLDDSERDYARDSAGRFSGTGEAADHADEHAELARAAAAGSSSGSARSRARKAEERAALARVAHEHGDLEGAARHAVAAEAHARSAIVHSGASEWTARQRMSALRGVAAAKTSADAAAAHRIAAEAFGPSSAEGRRHYAEAQRRGVAAAAGEAADARSVEERGGGQGIGVGLRVRGSLAELPPAETHTINEPSRRMRIGVSPVEGSGESELPSPKPGPVAVPIGPGDRRVEFGYTHAVRELRRASGQRHFSDVDRSSLATERAARLVGLPPPPGRSERMLAKFFGRRDSVDYARWWLEDRYLVDLSGATDDQVLARAVYLLGVPRQSSRGATLVEIAVAAARRDAAEWDESSHSRDELGKFGEGGGHAERAYASADAARAAAKGTTPTARSSARKAEAAAREAHLAAKSGDHAGAAKHAASAERHLSAVRQKLGAQAPVKPPTPKPLISKPPPPAPVTPTAGAIQPRLPMQVSDGFDPAGAMGSGSFTPEVQRVVRSHHDEVLASYGMTGARHSGNSKIQVNSVGGMGGARGCYHANGSYTLSTDIADGLAQFSRQSGAEWGAQLTREHGNRLVRGDTVAALRGYKTSIHEAIHGKGAQVEYHRAGVIVEEVSTEVSARRVVRDAVGLGDDHPIYQRPDIGLGREGGSYHRYIGSVTAKIASISGSGLEQAFRELERASLSYKSTSPTVRLDPDASVRAFASHVDFSRASGKSYSVEESGKMTKALESHIKLGMTP